MRDDAYALHEPKEIEIWTVRPARTSALREVMPSKLILNCSKARRVDDLQWLVCACGSILST